jgi:hypothetical protein
MGKVKEFGCYIDIRCINIQRGIIKGVNKEAHRQRSAGFGIWCSGGLGGVGLEAAAGGGEGEEA